MADGKLFTLKIITPGKAFFEGEADFVEMTTSEGRIGVYKGHIPMTSIIIPGTVKIYVENEVRKAAVHSGFVEIQPDQITILAEIAEWPEDIDINRAMEAKVRAERRIKEHTSDINVDRAETALRRSLARIEAKD